MPGGQRSAPPQNQTFQECVCGHGSTFRRGRQQPTFHSSQPLSTLHLSATVVSPPCLLQGGQYSSVYCVCIGLFACFSIYSNLIIASTTQLDFYWSCDYKANIFVLVSLSTFSCSYSSPTHSLPSSPALHAPLSCHMHQVACLLWACGVCSVSAPLQLKVARRKDQRKTEKQKELAWAESHQCPTRRMR